MKFRHNIICNSDSYKYSQPFQYPPGTEYVYSYIESRGGLYDKLVFAGVQPLLREYLTTPITYQMIEEAEMLLTAHGVPFYKEGWLHILHKHGGLLPVEIKSVAEGSVMRLKHVLLTIVNTDPACWWLTSFLETMILRAIWYMTTVASNSYRSKEIILAALEKTGTPSDIDFKLHDFGARGVSSFESGMLGDIAHLINFKGTDTFSGPLGAMEYYDAEMSGFSIAAMEHSTVTSWGRPHEVDAYRNMLKLHGKPGAPIAFVSDSYNIYEACKMWGTELFDDVVKSGAIVVIRPDSGEPSEVVVKCLYILEKYFGSVKNAKGYRVLNNVRVIQGDGINHASIRSILFSMEIAGFSADNVNFGQGGALLQQIDRDTLEFAMKCSSIGIRNDKGELEWQDVYKDPITSSAKKSKRGKLMLTLKDGEYVTSPLRFSENVDDLLITRFKNGRLYNQTTLEQMRAQASIPVR